MVYDKIPARAYILLETSYKIFCRLEVNNMFIRRYFENEDNVLVMILEGRIDGVGVEALDNALQNAVEDGHVKVILDMGSVDYLNTAGLHTLASVQINNRKYGGDLRLAKLSPIVRRVFQIAGFRNYFRNYSTVNAAMVGL